MSYIDSDLLSYPDPVYLGEDGEASATLRAASQEPELTYPNGTRCSFIATGKQTGGLFGIYLWQMAGEPSGPGPHFHRTITESFFVLTGTIRIYDGKGWIDAQVGDFVHVPQGGIHGFRNESGEPASMLIHFAPGAPREDYFASNARFAREGRPSEQEMAKFYLRHDNYFTKDEA
jgi:mannose-6-phosphate isomerase-like protein (cupin superfamily)